MAQDIFSKIDYPYRATTLDAECDLSNLQACEGFSYQPFYGVAPTRGYMVSVHKELELTIPLDEIKPEDLYRYMREHMGLFESDPRLFFGGWNNRRGGFVLDVSRLVDTAEQAEMLGRENQQESYYDIADDRPVDL